MPSDKSFNFFFSGKIFNLNNICLPKRKHPSIRLEKGRAGLTHKYLDSYNIA
jgi:hypothetical protein